MLLMVGTLIGGIAQVGEVSITYAVHPIFALQVQLSASLFM